MKHVWLLLIICFDEILWDIDLWLCICCDVWLCSPSERIVGIFCVDLHNQCDNAINQCYFIFALWSIMRLDTYYCLIFYELTLIHFIDSLSQVVQIMCVSVIYINIFIYIYISAKEGFFFLGWKKGTHYTLVLRAHTDWILGIGREELIEPGFSYHHGLSIFFDTSEAWKWLSMTLIKVSISFIAI